MKIATYNIWNENKGTGNRQGQILEEIRFCDADIIGLQEVTLDFVNNPRWHGENTTEIPYAADRIYVMYRRGKDVLKSVELFGTKVSEENGLSASDHYGVVAEMEFVFS